MSDKTINWFEIPVTNVADSVGFYQQVLGHDMGEIPGPSGETMHVFMGPEGPTGALVNAGGADIPGASGPRVYLHCDDIADCLARVSEAGGKLVSAEEPIGPYGVIGRMADLDGNVVGLHHGTE